MWGGGLERKACVRFVFRDMMEGEEGKGGDEIMRHVVSRAR